MYKKVFIKTFGCQMNEYDSNRIYDSVKTIGYNKTEKQDEADCYILNTCHIRDKAKDKVYHEIGRVKKLYKDKKKPIMVVAGCVAQAENTEMLNREKYSFGKKYKAFFRSIIGNTYISTLVFFYAYRRAKKLSSRVIFS